MTERPPPHVTLMSQKMGIHEWSYDNAIHGDQRYRVPLKDTVIALKDIRAEVELGFDPKLAFAEAQRCLNCDVADGVRRQALHRVRCVRRHLSDGLHHVHRQRRRSRPAHAPQGAGAATSRRTSTYRGELKTGRVMVKDEDVCLHCGLCAERCPTGAWDMQKFLLESAQADDRCRSHRAAGDPGRVRRTGRGLNAP